MSEWSKEDANQVYNFETWGEDYFDISPEGQLTVDPGNGAKPIPIIEVVEEMKSQGVQLPAVIRFHDVLREQVKRINTTFSEVIEKAGYKGKYRGVFPIKVNQMREVVEEVLDAGEKFNFGLEAGSKPELLAVLAYNTNPNALTVLNGYKDEDYIRLGLLGIELGRQVVIVLEKFSELEKVMSISKELGIKPLLGFRAKMAIKGDGRWAKSTGDRAKFGLSTSEMIRAVRLLEKENMKDSIKLFHFHIGSQISDIRTLKAAINEGGRIFTQLYKLGCPLEFFDAGGGLGVDYAGTRSNSDSSINYHLSEYVSDIVYGLKQICDLEKVPHPHIVTESGRALTAHHSMVVTNVVDKISVTQTDFDIEKKENEHILIANIRDMFEWSINEENYQEIFNEAQQLKEQGLYAFNLGVLSLEERATLETLYWKTIEKVVQFTKNLEYIPEDLQNLPYDMAPQYLCNFSVFQSVADHWAIDQLIPVVPLTRLNEKPTAECSIADITCDSDGIIDKFIDRDGIYPTMTIHQLNKGEEYLVGMFLTGAYQDVMGDMHNLFGRLNEVHVYSDPDDPQGFYIEEIIHGNSASKVLSTMQYNPEYMAQKMKKHMNRLVTSGSLPARRGVKWVDFYEECLTSYTYLKS